MVDTGRVSPSNYAESGNKCESVTDIYSDNGSYANCDKSKLDWWGGYDFSSIPNDATIVGIVVEAVDAYHENSGKGGNFTVRLSWNGRTGWTAAKTVDINEISSPGGTYPLGALDDTWGRAWTVDEIKTGFWVEWQNDEITGGEGKTYIDWMPVTVYYTVAAAGVPRHGFTLFQNPGIV